MSEGKWTCFNLQHLLLSRMPYECTPIIPRNNANFLGPNDFVMMSAIWSSVATCTPEISSVSSWSQICLNFVSMCLVQSFIWHSWWALEPHGCHYKGVLDLSMSCLGSEITICAIVFPWQLLKQPQIWLLLWIEKLMSVSLIPKILPLGPIWW